MKTVIVKAAQAMNCEVGSARWVEEEMLNYRYDDGEPSSVNAARMIRNGVLEQVVKAISIGDPALGERFAWIVRSLKT